ncbi:SAM-dependent methyltransferase [Methylocystis bryophila]|uniref:SAM-dependent methyltransferase n=1 Tax=Methylocystis bryophila TaxID=655015 RepID=A0A1W6MUW6_9HYPH|nr:cyclopropane-fatty-acyl-phospholipid synthase family protein [Methylocystis bryophila]ARN81306.1 SAM-dependent methyltransferase [Methylocystis bryophila]BDV37275.1 replicative DNA helicase [Methylocystis bryophila]
MGGLLRKFLTQFIKFGDLEVETASGRKFRVGDGTGPSVAVSFRDAGAELRLLLDPESAFGDLFTDGRLVVTRGSIFDALMIGTRNVNVAQPPKWLVAVQRFRSAARLFVQRNTPAIAKRNAESHYDIDGRIYDLFLDADKQYSCAYFEREGQSLEEAQLAKKRHIAAKLAIEPGQSVLDIGCGWGGLSLYLADACGAKVTGITLASEQLVIARERAQRTGLSDRVSFELVDYRNIASRFDRIVSVGMFEHVGQPHYDEFFKRVAEALTDDGVALLHTIGNTGEPVPTNAWVVKNIFPGGYVPSLSEIVPAIERAGLMISDVEILRIHYAETLRHWRERFLSRRDEAKAIMDERFCRMWEFYLAISEASFRLGITVIFQIQLVKKVNALPLTRDYIGETEKNLRQGEKALA